MEMEVELDMELDMELEVEMAAGNGSIFPKMALGKPSQAFPSPGEVIAELIIIKPGWEGTASTHSYKPTPK